MVEGLSLISFIFPIIIGFASIGVIVAIVIIAIKGVKGHGGKIENNQSTENTINSDPKATAEEINQKIKNIFANLAASNAAKNGEVAESAEKAEPKSEVKEQRCKNCGASLTEDKKGRLHCPYCQSKYF